MKESMKETAEERNEEATVGKAEHFIEKIVRYLCNDEFK